MIRPGPIVSRGVSSGTRDEVGGGQLGERGGLGQVDEVGQLYWSGARAHDVVDGAARRHQGAGGRRGADDPAGRRWRWGRLRGWPREQPGGGQLGERVGLGQVDEVGTLTGRGPGLTT